MFIHSVHIINERDCKGIIKPDSSITIESVPYYGANLIKLSIVNSSGYEIILDKSELEEALRRL